MDLSTVEKVMQLMRSYGMHAVEITEGELTIKLTQSPGVASSPYLASPLPPSYGSPLPGAPQSPSPSAPERSAEARPSERAKRHPGLIEVRSPFVGTFYSAPSPGADDFLHVGKRVKKGDTLCIIEAMKLMNEIEAEREGVIVEVLVENEEPVEYDQVLFLME